MSYTVFLGPGARSCLRRLMSLLREQVPHLSLGQRLLVVVPSGVLRRWLLPRIASELGDSCGVAVTTHLGLARMISERVLRRPVVPPGAGQWFYKGAARALLAGRVPDALANIFESIDSPEEMLAASLRDLVDAGFQAEHLEPCLELVKEDVEDPVVAGRAAAVLKLAAEISADARAHPVATEAGLLDLAGRLLDEACLDDIKHVLIYGFSDVTGVTGDFLSAVARRLSACVVVDNPPEPGAWTRPDPSHTFTSSLLSRLAAPTGEWSGKVEEKVVAPSCSAFEFGSVFQEARWVAASIARLLDKGVPPNEIAVASRSWDEPLSLVLQECWKLGIPVEAEQAVAPESARKAAVALRIALEPDEVTLAEAGEIAPSVGLAEVCSRFGKLTVGEALSLQTDPDLCEWLQRIRSKCAWPDEASPEEHWARLRELAGLLPSDEAESLLVGTAWEIVKSQRGWASRRNIFLASVLDAIGSYKIQGAPSYAVAVADYMRLRYRCHRVLYMVGTTADRLPRKGREDPLLPDSVRLRLKTLLPDIPIKGANIEEERYLAAHLISSSSEVRVTWHSRSADGRRVVPSPLVDFVEAQREDAPALPLVSPRSVKVRVRKPLAWKPQVPAAISVTKLEEIRECPWRRFLTEELRLEASTTGMALGKAVGAATHRVLEWMAQAADIPTRVPLEQALSLPTVSFPLKVSEKEIEAEVAETAASAARSFYVPEQEAYVRERVEELVRRVAELDGGSSSEVKAVEVDAELRLAGPDSGLPALELRMDRVGMRGGELEFLEVKTGPRKPSSSDVQMLAYQKVAQAHGAKARVMVLGEESGLGQSPGQIYDVGSGRAKVDLADLLQDAVALIGQGLAPPKPGAACRNCPLFCCCPSRWWETLCESA